MNREILFRGKRLDNGEWVEGSYVEKIDPLTGTKMASILTQEEDQNGVLCSLYSWYPIDPATVGQYTGLTDKKETQIFEGDIVSMPAYGRGKHISAVYFERGKFAVDGSNYRFKDIRPKNIETIGNIYDNPELLST